MNNVETGYVYILTNPSFKEDWIKIGKSSRPVDVRSKELDNTAVPLPFEIFATLKTSKYNEVEKFVHKTIDRLTNLRIRQNREFFNVPPKVALDIFRDLSTTIDDAVITEYENNRPIDAEEESSKTINEQIIQTDTGAILLDFWKKFNENSYSNTEFSDLFKQRKPYPQYWYDLSIGSSSYNICLTVSRQKKEMTAGIYIHNDKPIYNQFKNQAACFEAELGDKIKWSESKKDARFYISKDFDLDNRESWDDGIAWLYEKSLQIRSVLLNLKV